MELLTVQETAQMLKVAPITIRRYIAAGRLPAVKVGRGVRVRREAVERFVRPVEAEQTESALAELHGEPTSEDDPLWNIVGMVDDPDGPTDIAANKHKYLAEAYADNHER